MGNQNPYRLAAIDCENYGGLAPGAYYGVSGKRQMYIARAEWWDTRYFLRDSFGTFAVRQTGEVSFHSAKNCLSSERSFGRCPKHYATDHPLSKAPIGFDEEKRAFTRICFHGVPHPDWDTFEYLENSRFYSDEEFDLMMHHQCDGCCKEYREENNIIVVKEEVDTSKADGMKPLSEEWLAEKGLAKFTTGTGQEILVHEKDKCSAKEDGKSCPVHDPSDHPLRNAKLHWRYDRKFFERICEHGVGHPDPDSMDYLELTRPEDAEVAGIHGCDGCCTGTREEAVD